MYKFFIQICTFAAPFAALAHGEADDGHVEEVVVATNGGSSALLQAFSAEWWGLLLVSALLTAGLSYAVWRFLQVPKATPGEVPPPREPSATEKPAEKTIDHLSLSL